MFLRHLFSLLLFCSSIIGVFAQTGYWNDFSSSSTFNWKSIGAGAFTFTTENGEMKIQAAVSGYNNIEHKLSSLDISSNLKVKLKVKAASNFTMRIDLKDANGNFTNSSPVTQTITGNNAYKEYTFDYTGKLGTVDPKKITQLTIFFNAGGNYTGTVYFDDLIIGNTLLATALTFSFNQIGYELSGSKTAVIQTDYLLSDTLGFKILNAQGTVVWNGQSTASEQVPGWQKRYFRLIDFSGLQTAGTYRIKARNNVSNSFEIGKGILFAKTASSVIDFFKGMRCTVSADNALSFNGPRNDVVNVSGGWIDATGDPGKHMSHLSYANYFNPQQIPFVTWALLKSHELSQTQFGAKADAVLAEAAFGADYIVKNVDKDGYLYLAVFDDWGGAPSTREICEWGVKGDNKGRTANYQAAMREGAGIAIAALAKAYRSELKVGTNAPTVYLTNAEKLYAHLKSAGTGYASKNLEYCNDHNENVIDFYCGLMAATELYAATQKEEYLTDARMYATKLMTQQSSEGWLASDVAKNRPNYHAADEGLPILALTEYLVWDKYKKSSVLTFISRLIAWQVKISKEVNNPYSYPRQYVKPYQGDTLQVAKKTFFIPHNNETGYWWQGENARLASLSTAWVLAGRALKQNYSIGSDSISKMAISSLDWIMGKNPFDVCMITGYGHNTYPGYVGKTNLVGGICNGITSDEDTEQDVAWMPYAIHDYQNWRWVEQWLPHNAWYLLAVSAINYNVNTPFIDCHGTSGGSAFVDSCGSCSGGLTDSSPRLDQIQCVTTSLEDEDLKIETAKVFPNPAKETITIQVAHGKPFSYKIVDMEGNERMTGSSESSQLILSVDHLAPSLYSVLISSGKQLKISKFVLVR